MVPDAHLLIVDDDERIRGLLQKFLMRNGFLVSSARDAAQATLSDALQHMPAIELLQALEQVDGSDAPHRLPRLLAHLKARPSLSAAQLLFSLAPQDWTEEARTALRDAVARAAKPLQRYRCAACGFEAQHYFWQCPGCLSWDSYPPQRIDAQ